MKRKKSQSNKVSARPTYDNLPWPGLRAKDRMSRVITRAVKDAKIASERDEWAREQIARILDIVPPRHAMRLIVRELRRRQKSRPRSQKTHVSQ
jgi:hypothetical protein